jgi:hypothetical protein
MNGATWQVLLCSYCAALLLQLVTATSVLTAFIAVALATVVVNVVYLHGNRGVKDDILNYDAHRITPALRAQVCRLTLLYINMPFDVTLPL